MDRQSKSGGCNVIYDAYIDDVNEFLFKSMADRGIEDTISNRRLLLYFFIQELMQDEDEIEIYGPWILAAVMESLRLKNELALMN